MINSLRFSTLLAFILLLAYSNVFSQDKCGTVEYQNQFQLQQHKPQPIEQFEYWLKNRITEKKANSHSTSKHAGVEEIVTIPVVVHVIHNGETLGEGTNIPDEQIISQIDVLNEDFTRTNADKSNTPSEFSAVAADTEVNFVLAKRDPEGLPTTGIVRVQGSKSTWTFSNGDDDKVLKAHSYWPAEEYLNIWVTQSTWLGWAQFPVSDLEGLEDSSNNRLTDGIVIDYQSFGSIYKYPAATDLKDKYALGRTTTHEVGHFLGLRHIWGDGGCSVDDYCLDTPTTSSENFTSDCVFPGPNKCMDSGIDLPDMFQNFMDYSDDVCMNLFTLDQKSRIKTILTNSPRRKSLTTSKGGVVPVYVNNDLGIKTILSPFMFTCNSEVTPQLELRNYGSNDINQVTIETLLDNYVVQTANFNFLLRDLEIIIVELPPVTLLSIAEQEIKFRIVNTNNVVDGNSDNNTKAITLIAAPVVTLPLSETFDIMPVDWQFYSPEGGFNWELTHLSHKTISDNSIMLNCFDYDIVNEETYLISPQIDLSTTNFASLSFEIAHSNFNGSDDGLKVIISTDCGSSFPVSNQLYSKSGSDLATVGSTFNEYYPSSSNDWRLEQIDLSDFLGKKIQIGIIGVNGYGNNIFLDNIRVITSEFTDIAINSIVSPSPVLGINNHDLVFEIINLGSKTITSFDYSITHNNVQIQTFNIAQVSISPGQRYAIEHGIISGQEGLNNIEVELNNPNDTIDVDLTNNLLSYYYTINKSTDAIPLKASFDDETFFTTNSQYPDEIKWEQFKIENNATMRINGAEHFYLNAEEWLVTPLLDVAELDEASLYFDVSYALPTSQNSDLLQILVSENNGLSYTPTSYSKSGVGLATTSNFVDNWLPSSASDWQREHLDLTEYMLADNIRVAFVFHNKNANALYLDNVEFYIEANPDTISREEKAVFAPNPIQPTSENLNIYFELEERQPVAIAIYSQMGKLLYAKEFKNVLNQHYQLPLGNMPAGLVIIRVVGSTFQQSERIVVIK